MQRGLLLLLLITLGQLGRVVSQPLTCLQGCPGNQAAVCGEDGITYQNSCLAGCQGVAVVHQGRCGAQAHSGQLQTRLLGSGASATFLDTSSSSSSGGGIDAGGRQSVDAAASSSPQAAAFSLQDMQQFSSQGYRLTGLAATGNFEPQAPSVKQSLAGAAAAGAAAGSTRTAALAPGCSPMPQEAATAAVRRTISGLTYQLQLPAAAAGSKGVLSPNPTQPGASVAGFTPRQADHDGALLLLEAEADARPSYQVTSSSSAAVAVARRRASFASFDRGQEPAVATADNQPLATPETEALVRYMQGHGRRRLQQLWHQALAVVRDSRRLSRAHGHGLLQGPEKQQQQHSGHHCHQQQQQQQHQQHTHHQHQHHQLQQQQQEKPQPPPKKQQQQRPQRALQFVLGTDRRKELQGSRTSWPYSAVGQFLSAGGSCTGVMVGPDAVLTSAHCAYSRQRGMWQQDMVFVPHRHRQGGSIVEPYGRIPVDYVTTYSGWTNNANATDALKYDLAVVKLKDSSIAYKTGWLGLAWNKKPFRGTIISAGYPGDKARGSLWVSTCTASDFGGADTRFLHGCDSWNGQSGSPMWEKRGKDSYYLRAVLSYEACSCCSADCSCCTNPVNGATKITKMHYNSILNWR